MYLSILWHLHQPIYRSPDSDEYILPWVNYHITKNYYQMAALVEEEGCPCTMNLVPCLLDQMDQYGRGMAEDTLQKALEKDPEWLSPSQVARLTKFLPKGAESKSKREIQVAALRSFFSPLLNAPEDKDELLALQKKIQKEIIPYFRKLRKGAKVELTTSAYYHPLLPLLFDIGAGGESLAPELPFSYPQDGVSQIEKGRAYFRRLFGDDPQGFWPSEGGISAEVARAVAGEGYAFAVTDENILWKSLEADPDPQLLHKPYACEGLTVFFRDRELSDLISFDYHRWNEKDAVSHLLAKLEERRKAVPDEAICVIALDGENPWAGYRDNGVPFLRELYGQIRKTESLKPIFLGSFLPIMKPPAGLRLRPGTWLGSFAKWVGAPAKNAAWDSLARAREIVGPCEEIYIAEGSDWFWWFGEDNVSEFASLFEGYIEKAYALRERR
jgi:alpha-amylase/alpha-mannosidase (GH57 family)